MKLLDLRGNEIKDKEVVFEKEITSIGLEEVTGKTVWDNVVHIDSSEYYGGIFKAYDNENSDYFVLYFGKLKDKEKFKIGVWYTNKYGSIVNYQGGNSGCGVCGGEWFDNELWSFIERPETWKESTEEGVREMLTKEIKKRGYREGVKIKSLFNGGIYSLISSLIEIDEDFDIFLGDCIVFSKGKFAKIIQEQEELTINGEIWIKK